MVLRMNSGDVTIGTEFSFIYYADTILLQTLLFRRAKGIYGNINLQSCVKKAFF